SKDLVIVNGQSTLEFDVANTHPNEFNSVSIKPEAEGIRFYPSEYFIGPMNSDELFTIEFDAIQDNSTNARRESSEPINLTLSASYNNGINKHENIVSNLAIESVEETQGGNTGMIVAGLLLVALIIAGVMFYRKKKAK
ncbi:MAG: LPXTG cell wall anchor domain-containing protein, partial [Methanosarcina sp.]